jgi:hypothetical protein
VARIADEHGDGIRARMAVDDGEYHLTEHNRSVYRPVDHSRTISKSGCLLDSTYFEIELPFFPNDRDFFQNRPNGCFHKDLRPIGAKRR